jgi:hypothetical protein
MLKDPERTTGCDQNNRDVLLIPNIPYPELPTTKQIDELLTDMLEDICAVSEENRDQLLHFYYPLFAILRLYTKSALDRLTKEELPWEENKELISWFWSFLRGISEIIEYLVNKIDYENNPVYDQILIWYLDEYTSEPFQWNDHMFVWLGQWLAMLIDRKNHIGNLPFFIYINSSEGENFPSLLPKPLEENNWLASFGSRLLIPNGALFLSNEQKAELWDFLFGKEDIYGNETIDHSVRATVFEAIAKHFPIGKVKHLDLCGGEGQFITWLAEHGTLRVDSSLIDISNQAVNEAQEKGISATTGSAELPLDLESQVDVITIIFAIQWISDQAFTNVFEALKPGGVLIVNVYPQTQEWVHHFTSVLNQTGFIEIECEEINEKNQKTQYILRAKKPTST